MTASIFTKFLNFIKGKRTQTPADVAALCRTNTSESYDKFWGDEELVKAYMEPARVDSYLYVVNYILSKKYGSRVIDVGFGSGDFLRLLVENSKDRQFEIFGVDYSDSAVKRASQLLPNGKFITGDVYNLPYPSEYFDQVFCIQTLEHLKSPEKVLREFDRVCKKDGIIIISIPNGALDDYEGHVNFWNESEFKELIGQRYLEDFKIYNDSRVFLAAIRPLKG